MNLFKYILPLSGAEQTETLLENAAMRIERIVSNRASTDWYDQAEDEWIVLLKGEAVLEFEESSVVLRAGDTLLLPAHRRHRVASTSGDALWLTVFYNQV